MRARQYPDDRVEVEIAFHFEVDVTDRWRCSCVASSQSHLSGKKSFYICRFLLGLIEGYDLCAVPSISFTRTRTLLTRRIRLLGASYQTLVAVLENFIRRESMLTV